MNPMTSYMPCSIDTLRSEIEATVLTLDVSDLFRASANRDWAEAERYQVRDDVDKALLSSPVVAEELCRIRGFFDQPVERAVVDFLTYQQSHLKALHDWQRRGLKLLAHAHIRDHIRFWLDASILYDQDNAVAMYFSSDNWDFSVFRPLTDQLMEFTPPGHQEFHDLLTAGVQDVRTLLYTEFSGKADGVDRLGYIQRVLADQDWIHPSGIMPMLAYEAASAKQVESGGRGDSSDLAARFAAALTNLSHRLCAPDRERFQQLVKLYQVLYFNRIAYDIYEYFGFYAFSRQMLILWSSQTMDCQGLTSKSEEFRRAASLYQFDRVARVLRELM
jgi:hypothetical protein